MTIEEQVFVLTNNGQGAQQNAVPYTASDEARAQIHDVTVLMKGSETEISTQKLLHDTYTDWVKTDLPAASNILNPGGASEYATEYAKNYARDKAKDGFNNVVEAFEDAIIPTSVNLPPEATPLGRFIKKRWIILSAISYRKKHQMWSAFLQKGQPKNRLNFPL